jgi:hypothetical protein
MHKLHLVIMAVFFFLSGCATQPSMIDATQAFKPEAGKAIVLIAQVKDSYRGLSIVYGGFMSGKSIDMGTERVDVVAVSVPLNTDFYAGLIRTTEGYPVLRSSLSDPKVLRPTQSGIYLYGTIILKMGSIYLDTNTNSDVSKKVVAFAKNKYKNIFASSRTINF